MRYPNGVYIAFNLSRSTEDKIKDYCETNLPNMKMTEDLHCTLIFSQKEKDEKIKRAHERIDWKFKKFSKFWENEDSLVIEIDSSDLKKMNEDMTKEHDFISDWDEYNPHITLCDSGRDIDIENLPNIDFDIEMEHQIIEDLDMEDKKSDDDKEDDSEEEDKDEKKDKDKDDDDDETMTIWFVM